MLLFCFGGQSGWKYRVRNRASTGYVPVICVLIFYLFYLEPGHNRSDVHLLCLLTAVLLPSPFSFSLTGT